MAYAQSTRTMRRLFAATVEAERTGAAVEDVLGEAGERRRERLTRRDLLKGGAAAGAALALGAGWPRARRSDDAGSPRIAIVGSGLAGLRCAHKLWTGARGPIRSTVYEADTTHIGGRCWSLRDFFSDGLVGEHGGSFINHDQWTIRSLVAGLGLELEDVAGGDLPTGRDINWFDGGPYTVKEATEDWQQIGRQAFLDARRAAPYAQTFRHHTKEGARLDHLSAPEWLEETGIGAGSRFGRLLLADIVSEYGGDPADQSAINLIWIVGSGKRLELVSYDEKFHVVGGNDQIVHRMVEQLPPGTVRRGHALVSLARRQDGSHRLTFDVGGALRDVIADIVVLALPFSTLRDVDLSRAGLSHRKLRAIRTMGMGQNAKIHVQLRRKTWPPLGYAGSAYTDWNGFCVAWDDSVARGPHGHPAVLLGYPGGSTGRSTLTGAAHGRAPARDVDWFLRQIEPIFPGTQDAYTGTAYEDHWSEDRWHRGAYSFYRVGQCTTISGIERVTEGHVHFAGEHTSVQQQGFLDGAVESGERVVREIRAHL